MTDPSFIRNFCIIAHVDHGKSTLADRFLEITKTVDRRLMHSQLLDSNPIEQERGITIKLAPVRMQYQGYILNLIDTPGHVDFTYEVNRSLAACEGAILLIDATQGVQAQTLAHYHQARKLGLVIIPVINKVDIATVDIHAIKNQVHTVFGFDPDTIPLVSAKTGLGVVELLQTIISQVPPPVASISSTAQLPLNSNLTKALVFSSSYDPHLGVLAWVRVFQGQISTSDKLLLLATQSPTSALEVGYFIPHRSPTDKITAGEVGYVVTGLKDTSQLAVGDTLCVSSQPLDSITPLPGYQPIKPVVFVSFYPITGDDINLLRDALSKLKLQDSALSFVAEYSPALGHGFRIGFLGLLHADVVQERLEREFDLSLIAAAPSVRYEVVLSTGEIVYISKAMDLPDPSRVKEIREPIMDLTIIVPQEYLGNVMQLAQNHRGALKDMSYLGDIVNLTYSLPLSELIRQFYDQLKSATQGFATLDYEVVGFSAADLVKLDILIAGDLVDSLSQIIPRSQSASIGKQLVEKLVEIIPRQQFEISIQASIGAKVVARSDIKAFRKDVIAKLSGGDQTRKDKLLKKQKKGKARMKHVGRVDIPQEAFLSILKLD